MAERNLDTLLQIVAHRHRRLAIQHLRHEANGITTTDELVDQLHTYGSVSDVQTTDREELAIQLHHVHLPKLADYGVVEFDHKNRAVRYQADDQIESILDSLSEERSLASP